MESYKNKADLDAFRRETLNVVVCFSGDPDQGYQHLKAQLTGAADEIGYHYVIESDGKILMGRNQNRLGDYHPEYNENSVGIIVAGERDSMELEQDSALILLLDKLQADYPGARSVKYIYRVAQS
ncbi:MAG: hypothetical protein G3M78_10195 [Candidatus Nitrohelix vancouverensis]|uniref:N-acetylmuramoyl-L-alanine amidase domain-containing protein n=1 Tax=Candidatus Nitrohelix vancouverensis TaxID=2705534 RepID=A0A7T0C3B1_9BACT|nr:MAG: hypothetical protein G3M78_10195 [Candidatus Nitrohelix vancouverensis]